MSIFQISILKTYKQDESKIALRWAKFQNYLSKTEFIKTVKEEKYQDGFLHDIFEECLGYTLDNTNPSDFNLEREKKNETDGKKADGVIYLNGEVVGIIELKDQKSKNLDAIEAQAFNYHNSHSSSKYIIISNFDELRFYIDKKTAYEKFNLFYLTYEEFKKLHLLLSYESIKEGLPLKLKEKSANFEQQISKELYRDFSIFRNHLFENIVKNNFVIASEARQSIDKSLPPVIASEARQSIDKSLPPVIASEARQSIDKSLLLRATQKLCDRIIFILFAEDRGLLRHNTIKEIRTRHEQDVFGNPMYGYYKIYFDAINEGNEKLGIPKYNGGLFAKDELLDVLVIDDIALDMEAQKLSDYDFMSDVGVNILGHIFEQSLTDLEELNASINDTDFDKKKSKRKKDGVFYTPEYITRYIVQNTLGKLCEDKKEELNITETIPVIETSFVIARSEATKQSSTKNKLPRAQALAITQYKENLLAYREWLTNLKILDPACGSGAFLNQALEFLIKEHTFVRDMLLPFGDLTIGYEIEKSILENNLYGVDINEDAVEIARLSLWLRTAHKGRELTSLNDKIVCANSLLNMPFDEGSFDVVIGNPPYFNIQTFGAKSPIAQAIQNQYKEIWQDKSDILFYFIALAIKMTKNKVGFIVSNAFMFSDKAQKLRNYILENSTVSKITNFEQYMVFEDASVTTAIIELDKTKLNQKTLAYTFKDKNYAQSDIYEILNNESKYFEVQLRTNNVYALIKEMLDLLNQKIDSKFKKLDELFKIGKGMETAADSIFLFKKYPNHFPQDFVKKRVTGKNIEKYIIKEAQEFILYFENIEKFEDLPIPIQDHLLESRKFLENRAQIKRSSTSSWWKYTFPMHKEYYHLGKLFCSRRAFENIFAIDTSNEYLAFSNMTTIFDTNETLDLKYLMALLNSKILNFRYKSLGKQTGGGSYEYFPNGVGKLPIPEIDKEKQQPFINLVDEILEAKQKIKEYKVLFVEAVKTDNFDREIKLKKEIETLENRTKECEKTIDEMVYKLYDLTDDEIRIVEGS